jgi:signal transduction histidine kinase
MRSDSLKGGDLPRFDGRVVREVVLPGDMPGRAMGMRFMPESDDEFENGQADQDAQVMLVVARDTSALASQLRRLVWLLIGAGGATIGAALCVSLIIVARGLAPVALMADQIAAIGHQDLHTRIEVARLPAEISPVAERLNTLLDQLEAAFDRERSFTGNVAHELRTPVSGIRSTMEVALRCDRKSDQYKQVLGECLEIAGRMGAMIESLMLLSRLDAGKLELTRETVELAELVDRCWQAVSHDAPQRGLVFENQIETQASIMTDRDKLIMVMTNILDNANEYADEQGRIYVAGQRVDDYFELNVSNTGCTLTKAQAHRTCDRFWRADEARSDTSIHTGLGLALVQRLVMSLGGTVSCDVAQEGVFEVKIRLPV